MATISESYRQQQVKLHEDPNYGVASVGYAPLVAHVVRRYDVKHLLDYGAGKMRLKAALGDQDIDIGYTPFDPAVPGWDAPPEPCDGVACIDVLEHIEPDCLDEVLDDLARVTQRVGIFTVSTRPARKVLEDGRNAHLIQQPGRWWLPRFLERFELATYQILAGGDFFVVVGPRE
jgi:hypothetical protein